MHPRLWFSTCLVIFTVALSRAAPVADAALTNGLQTIMSNGVEAGVHSWYAERPDLAAEMTEKVLAASRKLGASVDAEVVTVQPISKRVTRYYVAVYFERSPLWIRLERYDNGTKPFFLPLKCSTNPDDILPAYRTELYP